MNKILTEVTSGFQACSDEPMSLFTVELAKLNPDAIVILTVRDSGEKYADSCLATQAWTKFANFEESPLAKSLGKRWFDSLIPSIQSIFEVPRRLVNEDRSLDGERRQWLIDDYERHNKFIVENVDSERLVVLNVKDGWREKGWEKVARNFGVDIPVGEDFPRWNSTAHFQQLVTGKDDDFTVEHDK